MTNTKMAYVEQDSASRPPTLHTGDITPAIMREFEDACVGYFESKEIDKDKQVKKILPDIQDLRIHDWLTSDCDHIRALDFDRFMEEFRTAYLDEDWEEDTRCELGGMTLGKDSFWDYAIRVQAKNSLLIGMPSHLNPKKLCHQIEAGMNDLLSCHCGNAKVNKEEDVKKWLSDVKRVDDMMRVECQEFEKIAQVTCDNLCKSTPLGEPSNCHFPRKRAPTWRPHKATEAD
jgi:hypothetical protein